MFAVLRINPQRVLLIRRHVDCSRSRRPHL